MSRRGGRSAVLLLGSGAALAFAFPEPSLSPLAWVALVPLLVAARHSSLRRGFTYGLLVGAGFFGVLLAWISLVGWVAWAVLVALQALYVGLFGACWALASRHGSALLRMLMAATLWVGVEYVRASFPLQGFSWGLLAQSQVNLQWMLKVAPVTGGWGISFVVVCVNALLAEAFLELRGRDPVRSAAHAAAATVLVVAPALLPAQIASGNAIEVAIVQGNVSRAGGGDVFHSQLGILRRHAILTARLSRERPDLVVWPESSVELDLPVRPSPAAVLGRAARASGAHIIAGVNKDIGSDRYEVLAAHVGPDGKVVDLYQKNHLVPFGEYVPARHLLGWIPMLEQVPKDAVPGDAPGLFRLPSGTIATVISFEGDFGSLVREPIARGGRLLVVATNTSTWGSSWASAQHLAFSRLRAAENGVWVAHAAISGISAFIAPDGSVVAQTRLWEPATLRRRVRFSTSTTLYTRAGDYLPWVCLAVAAGGLVAAGLPLTRRLQTPARPPAGVAR